jgi:hypothetical protein
MCLCYVDHTKLTQSQILDFPLSGRSPLRSKRDCSAILWGGARRRRRRRRKRRRYKQLRALVTKNDLWL